MSHTLEQIAEIVQQQAREIADLRVEIQSLKQMMFEHRPAFIPAFEAVRERVIQGEPMCAVRVNHPSGHHCG